MLCYFLEITKTKNSAAHAIIIIHLHPGASQGVSDGLFPHFGEVPSTFYQLAVQQCFDYCPKIIATCLGSRLLWARARWRLGELVKKFNNEQLCFPVYLLHLFSHYFAFYSLHLLLQITFAFLDIAWWSHMWESFSNKESWSLNWPSDETDGFWFQTSVMILPFWKRHMSRLLHLLQLEKNVRCRLVRFPDPLAPQWAKEPD